MSNHKKKPANILAFVGRGVVRTFLRDVKATVFGVCIGAILGFLGAYLLGFSAQSGTKFGALVGACVALLARSHFHRLFEYDQPAPDRDPDS